MPNVIRIKNNGTAGVVPSSLAQGELALNRADGQLYYQNSSGGISAVTDTIDGGIPSTPAALLMHFDNSTADSSTYARTVTTSGTATTSATQSKFGGYSAFFDGSSSGRIVAADGGTGSLFSFAGDFTVEAWVYLTAFSTYRTIVTRYNGSNNAWIMRFEGSGSAVTSLAWYCGAATGTLYNFATSINLNQWYHVAVCRSNSSVRGFLNGTQIGSTQTNSGVMTGGNAGCMIGSSNQATFEFPFQGYIDELRIIPQAMYTGTFTPSTTAFGQFGSAGTRTQTIRLRGGDAATLASVNPTPAAREPIYETDTRCLKVGDGSAAFASLGYVRPYVTATDRLLGRSTAGAGAAEEIACTATGRSVISQVSTAAVLTTIGAAPSASPTITGTLTLSGGQIAFPSVSSVSAGANTLDDYEEGTFTPTYTGSTTNPTVTYASGGQAGYYVKIGRTVFVHVRLALSAKSGGSGDLRISGLPFQSSSLSSGLGNLKSGYSAAWTTNAPDGGYIPNSASYVSLTRISGAGSAFITTTNLAATSDLIISGHYETDS